MPTCLIALGSNLGDRAQVLGRAVQAVASLPSTQLSAVSSWHSTAPVGGPAGQGEFLNGALLVETRLPAAELHRLLKQTEVAAGRTPGARWAERVLDLDILLYGDTVLVTPELTLPHPRMAFRRFVLAPAAEIAAEMRHPTIGWSISELLVHLETATPYVAVTATDRDKSHELAVRVAERGSARLIEDRYSPKTGARPVESSSRNLQSGIELARHRAARLNRAAWPAEPAWTISSFWFDDVLLWAEGAAEGERQELIAAWQAALPGLVRPKLLVFLDQRAAPNHVLADPRAQRLEDLVSRPGLGPILRLSTERLDENVAEVVAAMDAMS